MNVIQIPNNDIFEFQSDNSLVEEVYQQILNTNFLWTSNCPNNKENPLSYSENGYVQLENGITFFNNQNLSEWLNACVKQVSDLYFSRGLLEICDLWLVKQKFGQLSAKHFHATSMFSGLYYVTNQDSSETVFHFDDPVHKFFEPFYGRGIIQRKYTYSSKPKAGKLLIWPSYVAHSVNVLKEKNVRYSIAFNTMLSGTIGTKITDYCDLRVRPTNSPNYILNNTNPKK